MIQTKSELITVVIETGIFSEDFVHLGQHIIFVTAAFCGTLSSVLWTFVHRWWVGCIITIISHQHKHNVHQSFYFLHALLAVVLFFLGDLCTLLHKDIL